MSKPDYHLLADIFPAPVRVRRPQRKAKTEYEFNGRKCTVNKCGSEWEGWFLDDSSVTFIADRKRDVLADLKANAGAVA